MFEIEQNYKKEYIQYVKNQVYFLHLKHPCKRKYTFFCNNKLEVYLHALHCSNNPESELYDLPYREVFRSDNTYPYGLTYFVNESLFSFTKRNGIEITDHGFKEITEIPISNIANVVVELNKETIEECNSLQIW